MKRWLMVAMVVLLVLISTVTACAPKVSQEEYDGVVAELSTSQDEIQSLQGELSTTKAELSIVEAELAIASDEVVITNRKLAQGRARLEVLNLVFIPALTGEMDYLTEAESVSLFLTWSNQVQGVGDPELTAKFDSMISSASDAAVLSFFVYLMESTAKELQ